MKSPKNPAKYVRNLLVFLAICLIGGMGVLILLFSPATNPNFQNGSLFRGQTDKDLNEISDFLRKFSLGMGAKSIELLDTLAKPQPEDEYSKQNLDKPEEVSFTTADGAALKGLYFAGTGPDTVLVCFDGFGKRLPVIAGYVGMFKEAGLSTLLFDYRGFRQKDTSTPSSAVADADAAYDFLVKEKKVDPKNLVIFGRDVGSYVALRVAEKKPCKAIVLENPWCTVKEFMTDVPGAIAMTLVPDSLYTEDCLNNIHLVKDPHPPILVVMGDTSMQPEKFAASISQPVGTISVSELMPVDLAVNLKDSGEEYTSTLKDLLAGTMVTTDKVPNIAWLTNYEEALSVADKEKKNVLVDIRADWCPPCRKMDKVTFTNAGVVKFVTENFVPVRLDADNADAKKLAEKFSINAIPTILVLNPDQSLKEKKVGFLGPQEFKKLAP